MKDLRGYTLIEIILYIGLVSIILISATYFVIDATRSRARGRVIGEVNQSHRFISDQVVRAIRQASDIISVSSTELVLDNSPDSPITLSFDAVNDKITYQEGNGQIEDLHGDRILAIGSFIDRSSTSTKNIMFVLRTEFNNQGTDIDFTYSSAATTTVELRGY